MAASSSNAAAPSSEKELFFCYDIEFYEELDGKKLVVPFPSDCCPQFESFQYLSRQHIHVPPCIPSFRSETQTVYQSLKYVGSMHLSQEQVISMAQFHDLVFEMILEDPRLSNAREIHGFPRKQGQPFTAVKSEAKKMQFIFLSPRVANWSDLAVEDRIYSNMQNALMTSETAFDVLKRCADACGIKLEEARALSKSMPLPASGHPRLEVLNNFLSMTQDHINNQVIFTSYNKMCYGAMRVDLLHTAATQHVEINDEKTPTIAEYLLDKHKTVCDASAPLLIAAQPGAVSAKPPASVLASEYYNSPAYYLYGACSGELDVDEEEVFRRKFGYPSKGSRKKEKEQQVKEAEKEKKDMSPSVRQVQKSSIFPDDLRGRVFLSSDKCLMSPLTAEFLAYLKLLKLGFIYIRDTHKHNVEKFAEFEKKIGFTWTDKFLLRRAFTHPSYANEKEQERTNYQRLEFFGDGVLDFIVSMALYEHFPSASEGEMTRLRDLCIRNANLEQKGKAIFQPFLLKTASQFEAQGAEVFADIFEAVVGSLYLDQGFPSANKFVHEYLLKKMWSQLEDMLRKERSKAKNSASHVTVLSDEGRSALRTKIIEHHLSQEAIVNELKEVEARIGYEFKNKAYLLEALTHPSYLSVLKQKHGLQTDGSLFHYERLEFLGDAAMKFLVNCYLYLNFSVPESIMTLQKHRLVENIRVFGEVVKRLGLMPFIKHATPSIIQQESEYYDQRWAEDAAAEALEANGSSSSSSAASASAAQPESANPLLAQRRSRGLKNVLSDVYESIVAAILLDSGGLQELALPELMMDVEQRRQHRLESLAAGGSEDESKAIAEKQLQQKEEEKRGEEEAEWEPIVEELSSDDDEDDDCDAYLWEGDRWFWMDDPDEDYSKFFKNGIVPRPIRKFLEQKRRDQQRQLQELERQKEMEKEQKQREEKARQEVEMRWRSLTLDALVQQEQKPCAPDCGARIPFDFSGHGWPLDTCPCGSKIWKRCRGFLHAIPGCKDDRELDIASGFVHRLVIDRYRKIVELTALKMPVKHQLLHLLQSNFARAQPFSEIVKSASDQASYTVAVFARTVHNENKDGKSEQTEQFEIARATDFDRKQAEEKAFEKALVVVQRVIENMQTAGRMSSGGNLKILAAAVEGGEDISSVNDGVEKVKP